MLEDFIVTERTNLFCKQLTFVQLQYVWFGESMNLMMFASLNFFNLQMLVSPYSQVVSGSSQGLSFSFVFTDVLLCFC